MGASRALRVPDSDRISVRLAIAELMASRGELIDAQRKSHCPALARAQTGETLRLPAGICCKRPTYSSACMITSWRRHISSALRQLAHPRLR